MKKYIPSQMIRRSRFSTFYETWGDKEKKQFFAKCGMPEMTA